MAIKFRSTASFGGQVKPAVSYSKILWHVKETLQYGWKYFVGKIHRIFSPRFSCIATRYLCWLLPEISGGWIRNDYNSNGAQNGSEILAVCGMLCAIHHVITVTGDWKRCITRIFIICTFYQTLFDSKSRRIRCVCLAASMGDINLGIFVGKPKRKMRFEILTTVKKPFCFFPL
jgi:hypothetical protein